MPVTASRLDELNSSRGKRAQTQIEEHGLGQHLLAAGCLGEDLLALWDGSTPEADAFLSIQHRGLPEHDLEASHATKDVFNFDLSQALVTMLSSELFGKLLPLRNDLGQSFNDGLVRNMPMSAMLRHECKLQPTLDEAYRRALPSGFALKERACSRQRETRVRFVAHVRIVRETIGCLSAGASVCCARSGFY